MSARHRTGNEHEHERGVAALLFIAGLSVLIGMMAMVIDLGYTYFQRQRLQDSLDLAAIAATRGLGASAGNGAAAVRAAQAALDLDYTGGQHLQVAAGCGAPEAPGIVNLCLGTYDFGVPGSRPRPDQRFVAQGASCADCTAVRLDGAVTVPSFFARIYDVAAVGVGARAVAAKPGSPLARLTIRSTLASLDNDALARLFGLLGGKVNLTLVGWEGLVDAKLDLHSFLDRLILRNGASLNLQAGDYTQVLDASFRVSELLAAAIEVLGPDTTAGLVLQTVATATAATVGPALIRVGDVVAMQSGLPDSALDLDLGVLDVLEAFFLAANGRNALAGEIVMSDEGITALLQALGGGQPGQALAQALQDYVPHTNLFGGVATVTLRFAVIEPPRLSAIGNPERAKQEADKKTGADAIYVRTAQIRVHLSVNLPIMHSLTGLLNALAQLVDPAVVVLNDTLSLDVVGAVGDLVTLVDGLIGSVACILACDVTRSDTKDVLDIKILDRGETQGAGFDAVLDLGGGEAYVTDYSCGTGATPPHLSTVVETSVAHVDAGVLANPAAVFASDSFPVMLPAPLIDFGTVRTTVSEHKICGLLHAKLSCTTTTSTTTEPRLAFAGGGVALRVDAPLLGNGQTTLAPGSSDPYGYTCDDPYTDPPEIGAAPGYCSYPTSNLIASLSDTLAGANVEVVEPGQAAGSLSSNPFYALGHLTAAQSITDTILRPIVGVLSNALDPLLNVLLDFLGLGLDKVDVGANLSCNGASRLVN
ncbi:pilus assembly protein TadG-related protein [Zavarzinia sp.]|uniref:pilus assembly protein TadG-related protein n=1 Tax=Zavarzinia sp. TaxID=2027920 RepID=UPI0035671AE2